MNTTSTDTTATDREVLNSTRRFKQALIRHGMVSEEEARASNALRLYVGAKPLDLSDVRSLDEATLTPPIAPEAIKALRERAGASQASLARYIGASTATVSQWERGTRKPDGPALKLLGLAEKNGLEYIR